MLTKRDEMRLNRAIQESPQTKRVQELQAKISAMRRAEELAMENDKAAFDAWVEADEIVREIERIRDANVPKNYNDPWNNLFAAAVQMLPVANEYAKYCWYKYTEINL